MTQVIVWNYPELDKLLNSRYGPVGRDIEKRSARVLAAAKVQAGVGTGALKISINQNFERTSVGPKVLVGSSLSYALMHHEGTKPHVIVAKPSGVLKFRNRAGIAVYAHAVVHKGTKPNRFLTDNLKLAVL